MGSVSGDDESQFEWYRGYDIHARLKETLWDERFFCRDTAVLIQSGMMKTTITKAWEAGKWHR